MSTVSIKKEGNSVAVVSPYNPQFVQAARNLRGTFDRTAGAWVFNARDEENARRICREIYGTDGTPTELVTLRCKAVEDWNSEYHTPCLLAGRPVASARGRDSGARLGDGVVVLEGKGARSAGSAKWWKAVVQAGTVFEVRDVPAALAEEVAADPPAALEIEVVRDEAKAEHGSITRLRDLKTYADELIAAVGERGDSLTEEQSVELINTTAEMGRALRDLLRSLSTTPDSE